MKNKTLLSKATAALGDCLKTLTSEDLCAKLDQKTLEMFTENCGAVGTCGALGLMLDEYYHATPAAVMLNGLTRDEKERDRERCRRESGNHTYVLDTGDNSLCPVLVEETELEPDGDTADLWAQWWNRPDAGESREYGFYLVTGDVEAAAKAELAKIAAGSRNSEQN